MPRFTLFLFTALALCLALGDGGGDADIPGASARTFPSAPRNTSEGFTAALGQAGLRFETKAAATETGLAACDALAANVSPSVIADLLTRALHVSATEAQLLVLASVNESCPDRADRGF
ncbi:DUF732 domain-containing protein [Rhodococcus jostii]|uniref:DUF732 domain-containing protein n=1 Tax=Rhodococcus jostii TaxID=132919 RepID=UPI003982A292